MKVKFICDWDNSFNLSQRIINNYVINNEIDFEITYNSDYDYLFVFNRLKGHIPNIPKERIFTFIMEPSWIGGWDRNCFEYSNKVFTHDKSLFGNYDNIVECPSYMFYHMDYKKHTINSLLSNNNFGKKKKISMVVAYHPEYNFKNYKLRTDLALKLLQYNFNIDIYGRGWSSYHKNIKGPIEDKYDALIDYEYTIAIENSCEKNYVSEKFFDAPLCNSTPIYYGAPNISDIYDNYISIDANNIEQCLDTISDIFNKNDYNPEKIIQDKIRYYEEYNLYNKIKELIKI